MGRLAESIPDTRFNHFPGWYRARLASNRSDPAGFWFLAAHRDQQLVAVFPLQFQSHCGKVLRPTFLARSMTMSCNYPISCLHGRRATRRYCTR
jgi:hypothetical protein